MRLKSKRLYLSLNAIEFLLCSLIISVLDSENENVPSFIILGVGTGLLLRFFKLWA